MSLREQCLNASPGALFLPLLSGRAERRGPRREGDFLAEDNCQGQPHRAAPTNAIGGAVRGNAVPAFRNG